MIVTSVTGCYCQPLLVNLKPRHSQEARKLQTRNTKDGSRVTAAGDHKHDKVKVNLVYTRSDVVLTDMYDLRALVKSLGFNIKCSYIT